MFASYNWFVFEEGDGKRVKFIFMLVTIDTHANRPRTAMPIILFIVTSAQCTPIILFIVTSAQCTPIRFLSSLYFSTFLAMMFWQGPRSLSNACLSSLHNWTESLSARTLASLASRLTWNNSLWNVGK